MTETQFQVNNPTINTRVLLLHLSVRTSTGTVGDSDNVENLNL